jgi:hypothetical protein
MRKLFVLACAVAILAGCMSSPFYSTIYGKANPSYSSENSDGSTLIEFKFILDPFDAKKAMQRIDEYLTGYAGGKGFAGYDVENVNGKTIEKSSRGAGSWVAPASSNFVLEPSYKTSVAGKDQYGRIRLQVRFNK